MFRFISFVSLAAAAHVAAAYAPAHAEGFTCGKCPNPIVDLRGQPIMEPGASGENATGATGLPMTIGSAAASCIVKETKGPAYWALAQRLVAKEPPVLTLAESHAIVECVKKLPAILDGQIEPAVDPTFKLQAVE